jgi:hypothetical protein
MAVRRKALHLRSKSFSIFQHRNFKVGRWSTVILSMSFNVSLLAHPNIYFTFFIMEWNVQFRLPQAWEL